MDEFARLEALQRESPGCHQPLAGGPAHPVVRPLPDPAHHERDHDGGPGCPPALPALVLGCRDHRGIPRAGLHARPVRGPQRRPRLRRHPGHEPARAALGDAIRRHRPRAAGGDGLRQLWHEAGLPPESLGRVLGGQDWTWPQQPTVRPPGGRLPDTSVTTLATHAVDGHASSWSATWTRPAAAASRSTGTAAGAPRRVTSRSMSSIWPAPR